MNNHCHIFTSCLRAYVPSCLHSFHSAFRIHAFCILLLSGCNADFEPSPVRNPASLKQIDSTTLSQLPPATRPTTAPAAPAEIQLTLEEARQSALENNLDLRVLVIAPTIANESVSAAEAAFEAVFTTDMSYSQAKAPVSSQLDSSSYNTLSVTPGVSVPLRTGGTLNFSLPVNRGESDNAFSTLNPAYTSDLAASLSLPLLRGAGPYVTTARIRIAQLASQSSLASTRLEVIRVLANVDRSYWRLYGARRQLEVRKKQYDLAVAQLERAQRQVRAGTVAEVEVIRAESGVADQISAVINAENDLRDRQREIKRIINKPGVGPETPTILVPSSPPNALPYKLDPAGVLAVAYKQRMELLELELQLLTDTININTARNGMLPLVTFSYTYGVNALGKTFTDSLAVLREKDFESHTVGIHLEVPIGNEAARSQLRLAMLNRMQSLRTRDQRMQSIQQEVLAALDKLEANWQQIIAAQKRVILAARVVDAETRQFTQGVRTSTDVLNAQASLADAQTAEVSAVADYQISQVDISFAAGMLLGASKVSWQPEPRPKP
jgi:outer membrane protein TolC